MSIKTVSLDTAKKLKEAGFRQDIVPGDWYYVELSNGKVKLFLQDENEDNVSTTPYPYWKCPSIDELLEELPETIHTDNTQNTWHLIIMKNCLGYANPYGYENKSGCFYLQNTMGTNIDNTPDRLGWLWLWLKQEGLIGRGK